MFEIMEEITASRTSALVIDQNARIVFSVIDRGYPVGNSGLSGDCDAHVMLGYERLEES